MKLLKEYKYQETSKKKKKHKKLSNINKQELNFATQGQAYSNLNVNAECT